jgi:hypothetical protein
MTSAVGYAVVDDDGINVRTVSPTRRAAIVNWLLIECGLLAMQITTDVEIEQAWNAHRDTANVRTVGIQTIATTEDEQAT